MEKIDTPASQKISFNVVHDYFSDLNDKTPNLTTSLQPSIKVDQERKLIPRKAQSSALKGVKKEKSDIIEKKEVRLMEPNELGQRSPLKILEKNNSQIIDVEVNLSPELIKNEQKIETNNEEKEENIFSKKNLRKYNTAITDSNRIEPEPELKLEQEQEKNEIKPINREIKPKHNTYSFCEKKTENIKNSKLFSISQILNPLDKIDVENQTNLDWEENNQNLIFSNEEFLEKNDQKHWTFNQSKLNDFKNKLLEQDFPHLGKFTCITVINIFLIINNLN